MAHHSVVVDVVGVANAAAAAVVVGVVVATAVASGTPFHDVAVVALSPERASTL